jgi:hypothetical protein
MATQRNLRVGILYYNLFSNQESVAEKQFPHYRTTPDIAMDTSGTQMLLFSFTQSRDPSA